MISRARAPARTREDGSIRGLVPALGYRFDFKDRSIAFSGDTTPLEAVAKMAEGADVLVHEAMYVPAVEEYIRGQIAKGRPVKFEAFMAHMKADHSPIEDVGRIAQQAGVKTLVLSHLTPAIDSIADDTWRAPAAERPGLTRLARTRARVREKSLKNFP
jgi:ribonuclease BN (tRNA processing enzyme)